MEGLIHPSLSLPAPLALGVPAQTSHLLSFLFTTAYVGSIYLSNLLPFSSASTSVRPKSSGSRPVIPPISATDLDGQQVFPYDDGSPPVGSRDHPDTILRRMRAVRTATLLSLGGAYFMTKQTGGYTWKSAVAPSLRLLGIPTCLGDFSKLGWLPFALAPILLAGPLYAEYLDGDLFFQGGNIGLWEKVRRGWAGFGLVEMRNYIVGPLTEELVFRSSILGVSILGHLSTRSLIFGTPLWFGLAHAHHGYEVWSKGGKTKQAAIQALAGCIFQLGYTTLFGWFASYLFLRTGSILPPLISHMFCNRMGIYLPTTAVARRPKRKIAIWAAYLAGIAGFIYGIKAS